MRACYMYLCVHVCVSVCVWMRRLYIHDNLVHPDLQPPTIDGPSVTTVDEGDNLTLACNHLNSNPVEQFFWKTPNGSVINGTVNLALILPLTNISRSSSGNYTCTVQDDRNNTASSTITVIVQCKSVQSICECRECMCSGGRGFACSHNKKMSVASGDH